jgi:6-phosphogluconate dehydrogenase
MDLPVSIPTIDAAVAARDLSGYKEERVKAASIYKPVIQKITLDSNKFIRQCGEALYAATILCYAQGLAMLYKASKELYMDIPLHDVVKVWRGGCIIRSGLLEVYYKAYQNNKELSNILLDEIIAKLLQAKEQSLRNIIVLAAQSKIATPGLMSALGYLDGYTSERMPVNLIQAQRDYFGAHTYERIDRKGKFHTEWQTE